MAVTLDDIATRLGVATPDPTSPQGKQWTKWIEDAEWQITSRAASLDVDVSALDPEVFDRVVELSVVAMARKPDDSTMIDVSVDDGRVMKRYTTSTGVVGIEDTWWGWLGLRGESAAFSTRPGFEADVPACPPWETL